MPFDEFCREEREALVEILRAAEAALSSGTDISEGRTVIFWQVVEWH